MPLDSPVVRDLSLWNPSVLKCVWEISTPEKNSLYWSIMISYLITSAHSQNVSGFAKRLKDITGDSAGCQAMMDWMKKFNPFKKKHAFHSENKNGKSIMDALTKFKKRINRSTKNRPDGADIIAMKLAAASEMLNCFIEVYRMEANETKNHCVYSPVTKTINSSSTSGTIIIFHHPNSQLKNREKDTFGFGMEFQIFQPLHEKALPFILKKDKVLRENSARIQQAVHNSENFLVSLLDSDVKNVIPRIYKSPYILAKLQNAGYNTNPLFTGRDGLSAFHLCLGLPDSQYLNILYNYASNTFYQSSESCRKPGDETVKALNDLKRTFETDHEKSNGLALLPPIAAQRYREILRFNEYQMSVVKLMKVKEKSSADEIVLAILEEYINYFWSHGLPNDKRIQFENYLIFSNYYENLDSYTSILLLDRLLSVKNKAYSDLVKPLYLMVISHCYFPVKEHDHDGDNPLDCKGCADREIPFKFRIDFFEELKKFFDKIKTGSAENISSPADIIIKNVKNIPKDEFILARLKTSLETAISVEVNDSQSVLVIFRTLQVFGEVFETSMNENFASGFLLSAQIPPAIKQDLLNIRDYISHYKANTVQSRLKLEASIDLFQKIRDELKIIYEVLQPVFSCQRFKMKEFIMQSAMSSSHISEDDLKSIRTGREIWSETEWDQFKSFTVNVFLLIDKVIGEPIPKRNDSKKYFPKIKRLQDGTEALNLISNFTTLEDSMLVKHLTDVRKDLQNIFETLETREPTDMDVENLQNTINKYVSLLKQVLSLDVHETNSELKCENLFKLKENLKSYNVFEGEENLKIRNLISAFLEPSFEATSTLEEALKNSLPLSNIDQVLDQIFLSNRKRKTFKAAFLSNSAQSSEILRNFSYNSGEKALGEEHETTTKLLEMLTKDEYKKALVQHSSTFGDSLEKKFLKLVNQKMEFLIERINFIQRILIEEENIIRDLVKWGRSEEIKKHNKYLMRQRYVMELDVKSSLEMLLFDCMNIMDERKDLADIYTKMNDMFAGVDLRNILSHGNILVDSLGSSLDPDDLPSELITKMLELIDDKKALEALSNLWMKEKPMTGKDLKDLIEKQDGCQDVADIKKCPRWEGYAIILPTIR